MRNMLMLSLCLTALPLAAEEGRGEGKPQKPLTAAEMADKKAEHMERGLGLSADQKQKVKAVLQSTAAEKDALEKKLQKLERQTNEKIRVLLDEEQKEKFDMMRAHHKMMERRGGGPGGMKGPRHGMREEGGERGERAEGGKQEKEIERTMVDHGDAPPPPDEQDSGRD